MSAATAPATLPYCADPAADSWLGARIEAAREFALTQAPRLGVEALILTGSPARGEASVVSLGQRFRLLGDIEFLLLVRWQGRWSEVRRQALEAGRRATETITSGGDGISVEYTPATRAFLRYRARPSMFTYDLWQHGRVLSGRPDLLQEMPRVERHAIPGEDAMEMLLNRGLELLALAQRETPPEAEAYARAKTLLDVAGSALAFAGAYESSYRLRPSAFRVLLAGNEDMRLRLSDADRLASLVEAAARLKLEPTPERLQSFGRAVERASILKWILESWRWQAGTLLGSRDAPLETLVQTYLAREERAHRVRGWIKYAWHPLRPSEARLTTRMVRLIATSSPRRLVYAAVLLAIEGVPGWEERANRLLPAPLSTRTGALSGIVDTWSWLVRNN